MKDDTDHDEAALIAALLRLDAHGMRDWLEFSSQLHQDLEQSRGGSLPDGRHH